MGEVLSFGFNLAVLDPSDRKGNDTYYIVSNEDKKMGFILLGNVAEIQNFLRITKINLVALQKRHIRDILGQTKLFSVIHMTLL